MTKGEARRQEILERSADYVLAHGLQSASLRPLAAAAGTSDRMLLHYFVDKEELLTATLTLVTERLVGILDAARAEPTPFQSLLPQLSEMLEDTRIRPYLRLWLELVTLAAREQAPYRAVAQEIGTTFLDWIAAALKVDKEEEREPLASLALAIVEGFIVFGALGDDTKRTAALAGLALVPV